MDSIYNFIKENPNVIVTGIVPISHLIKKLKTSYNAEDVELSSFAPHKIQMYQNNAYYYSQDEKLNLQLDDIEIKVVRIPETSKTKCYIAKDFTQWYIDDTNDNNDIYVVYDEKSNYFYCNSSMLHLELTLARGISESDIKDKTEKYTEYVALMKRYIEDYADLKG